MHALFVSEDLPYIAKQTIALLLYLVRLMVIHIHLYQTNKHVLQNYRKIQDKNLMQIGKTDH